MIAGTTPVLVHNINNPIGCGPNGEPIYDIPTGSSNGAGAKKRISQKILKEFNIGKNADPTKKVPLCSYCRKNPAQQVDHVEPRAHGGDLTDGNLTPACGKCNNWKNDTPLNDWDNEILDEAGLTAGADGSLTDIW